MKSDSTSPRAKRSRDASRFQPYWSRSGNHASPSSSTHITRSKAMIWNNSGSTSEDLSFHTAVDCLLPMKSFHAQSTGGNDATKSIPASPSPLLEDDLSLISQNATSSPSRLTCQNAVILDNAFEAVDYGNRTEPVAPQSISSHCSPVSVPVPTVGFPYSPQIEGEHSQGSLIPCEELERGLSEAVDFTLNIIERPLAEMHPGIKLDLETSPGLQVMQQNTRATLHLHRENHCVQHSPKCRVPDPPQCFVIVILLFSIIMLLGLAAVIDIADWLLPPNSLLGVTVIISWGALVREDAST
ncbi:hypothetical protein EDC04DRAFT_3098200 [Pisolithus marmoratus]|nr:hypothetical protein EDC04DRAFT_3098200 [Pisolithus marmoratus]